MSLMWRVSMHTIFSALMANNNEFCASKDQSYTLTRVRTKIEFYNRGEAGSQFVHSIHDYTLLIAYCLWNCVALGTFLFWKKKNNKNNLLFVANDCYMFFDIIFFNYSDSVVVILIENIVDSTDGHIMTAISRITWGKVILLIHKNIWIHRTSSEKLSK